MGPIKEQHVGATEVAPGVWAANKSTSIFAVRLQLPKFSDKGATPRADVPARESC